MAVRKTFNGLNPYKWIPVNEVEAALFWFRVFGGAGAHVSPHDCENDGAQQRVLDVAGEQVGADVFEQIAHDVGAVALLRHHAFVQQVDLLLVPRRVLKRRVVVVCTQKKHALILKSQFFPRCLNSGADEKCRVCRRKNNEMA